MSSTLPLLPTTVIGSYPRPKWLREALRLRSTGRMKEEELREAFDDSVQVVLREHGLAGVDVPTDGEMRRDEMVEFFAERLGGFKFYGPVRVWGANYYRKPSVVSKVSYREPMLVDEFKYASSVSYTPNLKVTITGPYTMADWSYNEYYKSKEELAHDLAKVMNAEMKSLVEAGAKVIQVDEPAIHTHKSEVDWAVHVVNESVKGINVKVVLHVCYGDYSIIFPKLNELLVDQVNLALKNYDYEPIKLLKRYRIEKEIGVGVIDVHTNRVETPDEVAKDLNRVLKYLDYLPPHKFWVNPDCGLKLRPRKVAFEKLKSMVNGTLALRSRLKSTEEPTLKPLFSR
ncbi:methionine synthase [Sulfodiicoccus acidiphilus]|uniref:Methionine synthase n=1 Tax=Sulfodiicoccus acidiphilus TaxID=1670455 RepID=A0A348B191_9CREN|nr:methionine synthase [Sulfodiicoccus acidiphilus]BBD71943.1 methionine synthase [Sulfodiicoccus acidiphilus]GGT91642.1 methionine synthase [Sulfodiicoccus acidiphilus]